MKKSIFEEDLRIGKKLIRYGFAPRISFLTSRTVQLEIKDPINKLLSPLETICLIGTEDKPVILTSLFPDISKRQKSSYLTEDCKIVSDWYCIYRWASTVEIVSEPTNNFGKPICVVIACSDNDCNGDVVSALAGLSTDVEQLKHLNGEKSEKIYVCFTQRKIEFRSQWKYTICINSNDKKSICDARQKLVEYSYEIVQNEIKRLNDLIIGRSGIRGIMREIFTDKNEFELEKEKSKTFENIHQQIGDLYFSIGKYDNAIEEYLKALPEYLDNIRQVKGCKEMIGYSLYMKGSPFINEMREAFDYFYSNSKNSESLIESDYLIARRIGMNFGAMIKGKEWERHMIRVKHMKELSPLFSALINEQIAMRMIDNSPRKATLSFMEAANKYFLANERLGSIRCICTGRCIYYSKKDLIIPSLITSKCLVEEMVNEIKEINSISFFIFACDCRLRYTQKLSLYNPIDIQLKEIQKEIVVGEKSSIVLVIQNNESFPIHLNTIKIDVEGADEIKNVSIEEKKSKEVTLQFTMPKEGEYLIHGINVGMYGFKFKLAFSEPYKIKVRSFKIPICIELDTKKDVFNGELITTKINIKNIIEQSVDFISIEISPQYGIYGGTKKDDCKIFNIGKIKNEEVKSLEIIHRVIKENSSLILKFKINEEECFIEHINYNVSSPLFIQSQLLGRIRNVKETQIKFGLKQNQLKEKIEIKNISLLSKSWNKLNCIKKDETSIIIGVHSFSSNELLNETISIDQFSNEIQHDFQQNNIINELAIQYVKNEYPMMVKEVIDNICSLIWQYKDSINVTFIDFIPAVLHRNNQTYPYHFTYNSLLSKSKAGQLTKHSTLLASLHSIFIGHFVEFEYEKEVNLMEPIEVKIHFYNTTNYPIKISLFGESSLNRISYYNQFEKIVTNSFWYGSIGSELEINSWKEKEVLMTCVFLNYGEQTLPPIYWKYSFEEGIWSDQIPLNIYDHSLTLIAPISSIGTEFIE
ncbi:hypothetical protein ENUP19_0170G0006 [Entamoeba nuttalli]|uniref:Trs120/TRAPPC9 first Ig-like domain-containing protein n=2 Tax=Entamoeba nuttalli TaxID=412467 RepID=K2GY00_ENTNP|nr:hypothetical protein ENU1_159380 [Entamoeba nuttalli P19]EKE38642.1 hypothetical protein ENU1_159380 [Entamoeba nuttalli P19]|eukprot:XP_008859027.1 hypothetical protein ENU1_159380 [Entamoeba nuttalli P19]